MRKAICISAVGDRKATLEKLFKGSKLCGSFFGSQDNVETFSAGHQYDLIVWLVDDSDNRHEREYRKLLEALLLRGILYVLVDKNNQQSQSLEDSLRNLVSKDLETKRLTSLAPNRKHDQNLFSCQGYKDTKPPGAWLRYGGLLIFPSVILLLQLAARVVVLNGSHPVAAALDSLTDLGSMILTLCLGALLAIGLDLWLDERTSRQAAVLLENFSLALVVGVGWFLLALPIGRLVTKEARDINGSGLHDGLELVSHLFASGSLAIEYRYHLDTLMQSVVVIILSLIFVGLTLSHIRNSVSRIADTSQTNCPPTDGGK